jgi:hypothetical protein
MTAQDACDLLDERLDQRDCLINELVAELRSSQPGHFISAEELKRRYPELFSEDYRDDCSEEDRAFLHDYYKGELNSIRRSVVRRCRSYHPMVYVALHRGSLYHMDPEEADAVALLRKQKDELLYRRDEALDRRGVL